MKQILLVGARGAGKYTLVDDQDYEWAMRIRWYLHPQGYAVCRSKRIHRMILDAPSGVEIDHINGDKLDNRRSNLRTCTRTENNRNVGARGGTSKYKGVHSASGRWRASICVDKQMIQLGSFDTEASAALAFNAAARAYHGAFAKLNEVDGIEPSIQEVIWAKKTKGGQRISVCPRCKTNEKTPSGKYCSSCSAEYQRQRRTMRVKDSRQTFTREDVE